jgi:hypothetical protein
MPGATMLGFRQAGSSEQDRAAHEPAHRACSEPPACAACRAAPLPRTVLSGGAGSPEPEPDIRARIGRLIDGGTLPGRPPTRIWAGRSRGDRPCGACGGPFAAGEVEYAITVGVTQLLMHIRCVELWAIEAEQRADVTDIIKSKVAMRALPSRRPREISVGEGVDEDCDGCGRPISRLDVQYSFEEENRAIRFHQKCLEVWHQHRGQLGPS